MPLSDADIVQSNSGGFNTSSGSATLAAAATAGNTILIFATAYGGSDFTTVPSGYTETSPATSTSQRMTCYRKTAAGGETSATITMAVAQPAAWVMLELANLDTSADPKDAQSSWTTATAATASTGTTAATTAYDAIAFGVVIARDAASGTGPTWSGHTNGFVELADQAQAIAAGTSSIGMSLAYKTIQSLGSYEMTATHSLSPTTAPVGGWMVVFAAATSKRAASVVAMDGFERGTLAGNTLGLSGSLVYDAVAGSPAIVSTSPRTGSHCLELSASAAAESVQWHTPTVGSKSTLVVRVSVRFPGSLPAGDVELASFDTDAAGDTFVRFRAASSKLGVQVGTGTEQLSATTVAADTWYDLDLRATTSSTVLTTADWRLDGVDQTQAVGAAVASGDIWVGFILGWITAATATVRYDDLVVSDIPGNYPLGDLKIVKLGPDPAGTITISGSTANFGVMTANGTVAAWNAANALAAIDDIPPTIGASADGLVATTASATDYAQIPLETYDASGTASIRAVRAYLPLWAASGTAATCRVQANDGSETVTLFAEADPGADNSTTTPVWVAKMWKPTGGWTQAKLDNAVIRFGSNDATPDIGIHSVLAEVAVQIAPIVTLFGAPDAPLRVEQALDPITQGIIGLIAYTPANQGATLTYEINGVEQTPVTLDPATDGLLIELDAPDMPTISRVTLAIDPES